MDEGILKNTIFNNYFHFLKKCLSKEKTKKEVVISSKFKNYISEMNKNDIMFQNANVAVEICEDAVEIARKRFSLTNKIKEYDTKIKDIQCYINLSTVDAKRLKNLLDIFTSLTKERNNLICQLTDFNKNIPRMNELEKDADLLVDQIQEVEKTYKTLKQEINYLSGEKAMLEDEHVNFVNNLKFLEKANFGAILIFSVSAFILGYLYMIKGISFFVPTTMLVFICIFMVFLLYFFKRRIKYLAKLNILKQNKAVNLLNRKNVIYAYYTNFLKFEYEKFEVRNSQMLISNMKDFKNYKHITSRIDTVRKIMYETERELSAFLKEKNINYKFSINVFAKSLKVEDKLEYSKELLKEKTSIEKSLKECDAKHEMIWKKLEIINKSDNSKERVISQLIQLYFDEVGKLFCTVDKAE